MPESPVVLIAPANRLEGLRVRIGDQSEILAFADADALAALGAIAERRPALIVLERLFAATSRGAALIGRIKHDPELAHAEIRVVAHDIDHVRVVTRAPWEEPARQKADAPAPPADHVGTRRAKRFRIRNGVEVLVDGDTAQVIDMSEIGAQVVLKRSLRPYQRVRVALSKAAGTPRWKAAVAWSRYELRRGHAEGLYRVGIEFTEADPAVIGAFCVAHQDQ